MELSRELQVLRAIRMARAQFTAGLVKHAVGHISDDATPEATIAHDELRQLKSEGVVQIAEMFFVFQETGMNDPERLRQRLHAHNDALGARMEAMRSADQSTTPEGISRDRLASGILEKSKIQTLVDEAEAGELRFDQSSLSALLVELMAAESCRNLIILLAKYGFLKRIGTNNVRIRSLGILEKLYRAHLSAIADELIVTEQRI